MIFLQFVYFFFFFYVGTIIGKRPRTKKNYQICAHGPGTAIDNPTQFWFRRSAVSRPNRSPSPTRKVFVVFLVWLVRSYPLWVAPLRPNFLVRPVLPVIRPSQDNNRPVAPSFGEQNGIYRDSANHTRHSLAITSVFVLGEMSQKKSVKIRKIKIYHIINHYLKSRPIWS